MKKREREGETGIERERKRENVRDQSTNISHG